MPELTPNDDPRENVGNADSMIEYEYKDRSMTKAERQMGMNFGEGKAH